MLKRSTILAFAAIWLLGFGHAALACDTPVYRYAMYRWMPAPYEIYCFHRGPLSADAVALGEKVRGFGADVKQGTNVVYVPVDLAQDPELKTLPPDVASLWKKGDAKDEAKEGATYLVVSPQGRAIYRGALSAEAFAEMVDSPTRRKIGEQLAKGHAGVFILLANGDAAAREKAEKLLAEVGADVRSGKIDLYVAPQNGGQVSERPDGAAERPGDLLPVPRGGKKGDEKPAAEKKEGADKKASLADISVVVVRRDDPKEQWLVRQLLAVESDLAELDQPMIFTSFGRGRVMPPLVGKGIRRDNLEEALHYVTGACVCTVRDQNPGFDLLTRFDWTTAAEKMAALHGSEEGARFALRDLQLFPESPASESPAAKPEEKKGPAEKAVSPEEKKGEPANPLKASDVVPPEPDVIPNPSATKPAPPTSTTSELLLWLGGGLAVAIVAVAIATWWLLRGAAQS